VKRFAIAALLAVFACAPSVGWADTTGARSTAAGDTIARRSAVSAPVDSSPGEAAAPALGAFAGGHGGIYIGGGAAVVILLVIIIVLLV